MNLILIYINIASVYNVRALVLRPVGRPRFCFVLKGLRQLKALPYFNSIAAIMAQLRSFKAASLPEWEF